MSATFVTIVATSYRVLLETAFEDAPTLQGDFAYADGGNALNSLRTPKRQFAAVIKCDPPAVFDSLLADISVAGQPGVPTAVSVSSPSDGLTRGATIQAYVFAGRSQYKSKGAGTSKSTWLSVPISIREA